MRKTLSMRAAWLLFAVSLFAVAGCSTDPSPSPTVDASRPDREAPDVDLDGTTVPGDANPTKMLLCEASCARQESAMCAGFVAEGCTARCVARFAAAPSRCRAAVEGVLRCIASFAVYTCGSGGDPTTADCVNEEAALGVCENGDAAVDAPPEAAVDASMKDVEDVATPTDIVDVPVDLGTPMDVEDVTDARMDVEDAMDAPDAIVTPDAADGMMVADVSDVLVTPDVPVDVALDRAPPADHEPTLMCPPPAGAITLPGAAVTLEGMTAGVNDIPSTLCRPDTNGPEQTYTLTASARTGVVIDTEGTSTSFDTVLSVRRMCDDARTEVLCDDDTGRGATSSIRAVLDPGTYAVLIDGVSGQNGRFSLRARSFTPAANATCAGAVTLAPGATLSAQNTAVGSLRGVSCRATEGGALFYSVTVPPTSRVVVRATPTGAAWAPSIAVADNCTTRTCASVSAGEMPGVASAVTLVNSGTAARAFIISVASTTTTDGTFDLAASAAMSFARGVTCDTPVALTAGTALQTQDTVTAFVPGGAACLSSVTGPQLFYSITIPGRQRATVRVTPTSSPAWTPTVRVLRFCTATTCAASATASAPGNTASLTFDNSDTLALNVIIAVAGASPSATGVFDILVSLGAIPAGGACETATALTSGAMVSGNTLNGMRSGASLCEPSATGGQLYYSLRVPNGQRATIRVTPTGTPAWRPTVRLLDSCMATVCLQYATANGVGADASLVFDNNGAAPRDLIVTLAGASVPPGGAFTMTATLGAIEAPPYTVTMVGASCEVMDTAPVLAPPDGWTDDTATDAAPLPFAFTLFSTASTHYTVSSNGVIELWPNALGESLAQSTNRNIPNVAAPNGFIAPFWDDLVPSDETTTVRAAAFGVAPNRRFVVQWSRWEVLGAPSSLLTFQVKLFEATRVIDFHYCTLTPAGGAAYGSNATIGVEDATGTRGVEIGYDRVNALNPAVGYRLTPR